VGGAAGGLTEKKPKNPEPRRSFVVQDFEFDSKTEDSTMNQGNDCSVHRRGSSTWSFRATRSPRSTTPSSLDEIGVDARSAAAVGATGVVRTIALGSLRRTAPRHDRGEHQGTDHRARRHGDARPDHGRAGAGRSTSGGPVNAVKSMSIHRQAPTYEELSPSTEVARGRHQGHRPSSARFAKGGKIGLFGGAGRWARRSR